MYCCVVSAIYVSEPVGWFVAEVSSVVGTIAYVYDC